VGISTVLVEHEGGSDGDAAAADDDDECMINGGGLVVVVVAGWLQMDEEWLVLVTAGLNQSDCGTSMVAWRAGCLFDDGDVVVAPHSTPFPPPHEYSME